MKIRNGFVSNSSSSSFICEVSGTVNEGMDDTPISNFGMIACEDWHTFFKKYVVNGSADDKSLFIDSDYEYDEPHLKKEYCPICTLSHISKSWLISYANSKTDFDLEGLTNEITNNFNSLEELRLHIQGKRNED